MPIDDPGAVFKLVGGRLCLDFVNTVSGRLPNPRPSGPDFRDVVEKERFVTFGDLVRWAATVGLLAGEDRSVLERAASAAPRQSARVVARARALREAIYRAFKAGIEGWEPLAADIALLNRELARAREREVLTPRRRGFGWLWLPTPGALDRVLWPVALSAADLLTSDALHRVRQCGGDECAWLFLDTSRNRSRRWCDMADCGNRAKVRRFRRRH